MKLGDSYNEIIAEKVVELALTRTGLVDVEKNNDLESDIDLIARSKSNPDEYFLIEVKQTKNSLGEIKKLYSNVMDSLKRNLEHPYILFFINPDSQTGYFEVLSFRNSNEIQNLRIDLLSNELSQYLSAQTGFEFPPYTFFKRGSRTKYSTIAIPVDQNFRILRLHNLKITPIENKSNFTLEVNIAQGGVDNKYQFRLGTQFYNPNLKEYVFLISEGREFTDIPLPIGNKKVTFRIVSTNDIDFEILLACEYYRANSTR